MIDLLPRELEEKIPALYSTEEVPIEEKIAVVKYFSPYTNWTWLGVEGGREDGDYIFFGLVYGFEKEWGYFSLSELEGAKRGELPLVERDTSFQPTPISSLAKVYDKIYKNNS